MMTDTIQNLTKADLEVASVYYEILIGHARSGRMLNYGELVTKAKSEHPDNEFVQRAIAVSTGRRLEAVRVFTNERGYPDITSLVVNATTGEVGSALAQIRSPAARRSRCSIGRR